MKSAPFLILILLISSFQSANSFASNSFYLKYQVHISSQNEIVLKLYVATQKFKFNSTLNGVLIEKFKKANESCYEVVYDLNATLNIGIKLPIFPSSGPISYSNSTLICSFSEIFSRFTTTSNTNTFSSNATRMNYDLNLNFKGIKDYKDIKTAYFIGNATFNYNNTVRLSFSTNFTLLSSLIDNIPVHFSANSSLEFYNETGDIQRFKSKAFIEISLEDTNNSFIKNVRNFNIKDFKTSTGVKFVIITNSSIESIQALGETLEVNTSGSSNSFFYLVFGKKNLFIDPSKINVDGNRTSFSLLYFIDYASLSFIHSQRTVKINLGANVGYYSTTTSEAVNTNSSYLIMIIAMLAILSLLIIILLRKRAKL